ncbi:Fur family transcriptional regulator [Aestuariivirga litoralis]|uniref:Fur family transcriptional regulator n=1 Tax=Aestuariivirga litoralis TaxID=2650924 RepID=UPI0018C4E365|nr:transcriptional repressor [Aestuariivirga litoralis]MBG1232601.1 transcriptional repressor [Aestuariivirga litoralis]
MNADNTRKSDLEVSKVLTSSKKPLSAYDLMHQLQAHGPAAKFKAPVQVYRALERLMKQGEVHKVASLNAFVPCRCAHDGTPPGFLVCTGCGTVSEFDAGSLERAARHRPPGFVIEATNVEISGKCQKCLQKGA